MARKLIEYDLGAANTPLVAGQQFTLSIPGGPTNLGSVGCGCTFSRAWASLVVINDALPSANVAFYLAKSGATVPALVAAANFVGVIQLPDGSPLQPDASGTLTYYLFRQIV